MILDRDSGEIEHKHFYEIVNFLSENDVLVLNNTKVIPARMYAKKLTGGKVELLLLKKIDNLLYEVLLGGAGKIKENDILILPDEKETCTLLKKLGNGKGLVRFNFTFQGVFDRYIDENGITPTPPYIKRDKPFDEDKDRYQTVFAESEGSCAAPTAGLHFTKELLEKIKLKGVEIIYITLHVGFGTFKPIKCDNIEDHAMDSEFLEISDLNTELLNNFKKKGKRIIAVGTTTSRALESASIKGFLKQFCGETSLFIYPGYKFKFIDSIITNFHLPDSTLILLVSAFTGKSHILNAYREAIKSGYRFYSYGDAMFIR